MARQYVEALHAIVHASVGDDQRVVTDHLAEMHKQQLADIGQAIRDLRATLRRQVPGCQRAGTGRPVSEAPA
ncbi:hypothetical protein [Nonomuraea sp. NPDC050691]|uniref:hypothetical protein n=1 Tax=Nonomuraea sp. NPDC050691 TaxID=3155661 RepID=UPI0033FB02E2